MVARAEELLEDAGEELVKGGKRQPVTTPWRWYVLTTYTFMAAMQGMTWAVPGVVQPTMQAVYGVSADTVQLLLNYGPVFYLLFAVPTAWGIDRFGIRGSTWVGIILVLIANVMRLGANDASTLSVVLVHLSFVLNAIAGPMAMGIPSKLAEEWFPPLERTTATAIAALGNQSGTVVLYVLVPVLCPDTTASDILHLNAFLAGLSILNALMAFAYLPNHPPTPPSASAAMSRREGEEVGVTLASLARAMRSMLCNGPYMAILTAYSLVLGMANTVGALITANLMQVGGNQAIAGWVGFGGNLGSLVVGVTVAALTDRLKARSGALKAVLVGSTTLAGLSFGLYAVCLSGAMASVLPTGPGLLTLTAFAYAASSIFTGVAIPLYFDLAAELTYPLPEGTMLMGMTTVMNFASMVVLFAPASTFFSWANWATTAVTLLSAVLLAVVLPTNAPRFEFDESRLGQEEALLHFTRSSAERPSKAVDSGEGEQT